jgi:hypothetical protein
MVQIDEVDDAGNDVDVVDVKDDQTEEKAADKKADAPAAPAGPELKISQILPMVVMLGLQKFDLEEMGYVRYVEFGFAVVQIACILGTFYIYKKIEAAPDSGKKIKIPEVKQFGQVVTPATEQTPKEYDMIKWKEQIKQSVMGCCVLGGVYYKWGYLMPLVLQILMTPTQLYESPLFQLHVLAKKVTRPFPTPNPFGLPSPAPAQAEEVEDKASDDKDDSKKDQ